VKLEASAFKLKS